MYSLQNSWPDCLLVAKKYNQLFPSKKEKSSKKKEEKPPAEKKAAKPEKKKEQEQHEEEEPAVKEPKFKDPYADLPKRLASSIIAIV